MFYLGLYLLKTLVVFGVFGFFLVLWLMGPVGGTGRWDHYTYQVNIKILYVFALILYQSNFILCAFWNKRHAQAPPKRGWGTPDA